MEKYEIYYFTEHWQLQISLCLTIFPAFIVDVFLPLLIWFPLCIVLNTLQNLFIDVY